MSHPVLHACHRDLSALVVIYDKFPIAIMLVCVIAQLIVQFLQIFF